MARKVGGKTGPKNEEHKHGKKVHVCFGCGVKTTNGKPSLYYSPKGKRKMIWRCPKCEIKV